MNYINSQSFDSDLRHSLQCPMGMSHKQELKTKLCQTMIKVYSKCQWGTTVWYPHFNEENWILIFSAPGQQSSLLSSLCFLLRFHQSWSWGTAVLISGLLALLHIVASLSPPSGYVFQKMMFQWRREGNGPLQCSCWELNHLTSKCNTISFLLARQMGGDHKGLNLQSP